MKDRVRVSARQNARGSYTFEATYETDSDKVKITTNPDDLGDVQHVPIGQQLLDTILDTEMRFKQAGKMTLG